jgi:type I restriction enzyme S subunit
MLPEGWELSTLGKMVSFSNGKAHENEIDEQGAYILVNSKFISSEGEVYKKTNKSLCPAMKDDILIVMSDVPNGKAIAKCFYVLEDNTYTVNQRIGKLTASGSDPKFIFYAINRNSYYLRFDDGITQTNLKKSEVLDCPIPRPPLPEQKKIAQILSTWDNAISATERLLENSQQRKKGLMQQLLTGKKRLPGFEGEWESGTLGEIANIDSGYAFKSSDFTDSEEGIPIVKMSDFKEGRLDLSQAAKVSTKHLNNIDKFKLQVGDFVFGMSGSLSNYAWVKMENLPCYLNQRVGRIVSKKNSNHLFVTYLYLSDKVQQSILDKAAGAAQLNISVTDLRKLPIKYPSKIEQEKISSILMVSDQEIDALQKRLDHLKQEKKALMQQLLTGKRRVQVDDAA